MAFLIGGANSLTAAYDVANSCRIETGTDVGVYYTPGENGAGAGKKFTFSCWVKRSVLGANSIMVGAGTDSGDDDDTCFRFTSADLLQLTNFAGSSATLYSTTTTAKFRDVAAWYHCVASVDTADGTEANRVKLYVNGEYISGVTGDYPAQNHVYKYCMQHMQVVGGRPDSDPNDGMIQCTGGYLAEVMMVDNQQLAASSFGETDEDSGIWKPKDISSIDVGTNGFYLEFKQTGTGTAGTTTIGADTSGETNHLTSTGLAATDITTDTPTNNFATFNSLDGLASGSGGGANCTWTEGNTLTDNRNGAGEYPMNRGTIALANGKWYWEVKYNGDSAPFSGVISQAGIDNNGEWTGGEWVNDTYCSVAGNGASYYNYDNSTSDGSDCQDGDIAGWALDCDNHTLKYYKNGTLIHTDSDIKNPTTPPLLYFPVVCGTNTGSNAWDTAYINFGNPAFSISSGNADANGYGNFEYAVPSGYFAICTKNLADYG